MIFTLVKRRNERKSGTQESKRKEGKQANQAVKGLWDEGVLALPGSGAKGREHAFTKPLVSLPRTSLITKQSAEEIFSSLRQASTNLNTAILGLFLAAVFPSSTPIGSAGCSTLKMARNGTPVRNRFHSESTGSLASTCSR